MDQFQLKNMTIQPNSVVALTYDLYTTENGESVFVEQANQENPLIFLFGTGMMLPKFEENLWGLQKIGNQKHDFRNRARLPLLASIRCAKKSLGF